MTSGSTAVALREIGTLFGAGTVAGMTDGQLLERFLSRRDEGAERAFAALVARHGPMVLGVCRRALADLGDADDAFQATFLILVRKAGSVRVDDSLGRWLYGVSRRVAARARAVAARRPRSEAGALDAIEADAPDPDRFEAWAILDEELARLGEPYRSALVLCDLGGLTHEEAARDLGCAVGTIKSRLARGRARLRVRLERRGLAPMVGAVAPAVPAVLAEAAARAGAFSRIAGPTAAGLVPAPAVALAQEVLKAMTGIKLKLTAAAALSLGIAATGAGVIARPQEGGEKSPAAGASQVSAEAESRPSAEVNPIAARLEEPVSLDLKDRPLSDAVHLLQNQTGLSIILDPKALIETRVDPRTPVSLTADRIQLKTALKSLLRPLGLTYKVEDDCLLITRPMPTRDEGSAALRVELDQARKRLAAAKRFARDSKDPAVVRAQKEMAELEAALARVDTGIVTDPDGGPGPEEAAPSGRRRMSAPGAAPTAPPREFAKVSLPDYIIEPPDIILVEVLEALPGRPITGERLVQPDGKINLGFYGEVYVAGLTKAEVKAKVALHLREWINDDKLGLYRLDPASGKIGRVEAARTSRIFVDVAAYNSKVYYVEGEVGSPGRVPSTGNETVLDAIHFAGGLTERAAKDRIRLIRPAPVGNRGEQSLDVHLDAIIRGDSTTNYQLLPGDRLIVDRDPRAAPGERVPAQIEARLGTVERKLDEVLKALERLPKP